MWDETSNLFLLFHKKKNEDLPVKRLEPAMQF